MIAAGHRSSCASLIDAFGRLRLALLRPHQLHSAQAKALHSPAHTLPIGPLANQRICARSRIAFQATRPADQTARRTRVSVFVICHNEVDRIEACLQSVVGWADELVVLDSGSTDGTLERVRRYTTELLQTDWPGFGAQRNRALQHVTGDWVFSLDADERLTPALRDEIDRVFDDLTLRAALLMVPWRTYFFGRPLRFGRYASPQGKLFKRDGARYREHQVHESLVLPAHQQALLKSPLLHHSWRGYEHVQTKHLKYACLLAQQKNAQGLHTSLAYASLRFFTFFSSISYCAVASSTAGAVF